MAKIDHDANYKIWMAENKPNIKVIGDFSKSAEKIKHHCNTHDVDFEATPASFKFSGRIGCLTCAKESKLLNTDFEARSKVLASSRKTLGPEYIKWMAENRPHVSVVGEYKTSATKIKHRCTIHDVEFDAYPDMFKQLDKAGCHACGQEKRNAGVDFVERAKNRSPDAGRKVSESLRKSDAVRQNSESKIKEHASCYGEFLAAKRPHIALRESYRGSNIEIEHFCSTHDIAFMKKPGNMMAGVTGCDKCSDDARREANSNIDHAARNAKIKATSLERYGMSVAAYFSKESAKTRISGSVVHLDEKKQSEYFDPEFWKTNYTDNENGSTKWLMAYFDVKIDVIKGQMSRLGIELKESGVSFAENQLAEYVQSLGFEVLRSDRTIIRPKEIDIVIPSKKIAIEYNGVFWHSEGGGIGKHYHADKVKAANDAGYSLIQVWEDDWNTNPDKVSRMIAHKLGITRNHYMARKCEVKEIATEVYNAFLDTWHMQGSNQGAKTRLGLFDKITGHLVAVMGFAKCPSNVKAYGDGRGFELTRFASVGVPGAFSKLFKWFVRTKEPEFVYSFADLELVNESNNVYVKNGFEFHHRLEPDYKYVKGGQRMHKFGFRKAELQKMGIDIENKTESQIAQELGILKVWDSGKIAYIWKGIEQWNA